MFIACRLNDCETYTNVDGCAVVVTTDAYGDDDEEVENGIEIVQFSFENDTLIIRLRPQHDLPKMKVMLGDEELYPGPPPDPLSPEYFAAHDLNFPRT